MLLRGEELAAAFEWLQAQPEYAPEPTLLHIAYITSGQEAEAARANAERQRLEQMAVAQAERQTALDREQAALQQTEAALREAQAALRNRQRAQMAVAGLLCCLVAGLTAWINQAWLMEQFNWYTKMRPYMIANVRPHVLSVAEVRALSAGAVFRECARDCPEMVVVPAGSFVMGAASTLPERADEDRPTT